MDLLSAIFVSVGALLEIIGVVIWQFQKVELIAGYDQLKVIDKEGLAKWVGSNLLIMGSIIMTISFSTLLFRNLTNLYEGIIFIVVILGISTITAIGCKRYEKNN